MNSVNGIKKIVVAGHSDSLPISNYEFRSNWDLSAARAVSVVHRLLENKLIDRNLLVVIGLADTEPVLPNTTYANRAANRRVEIKVEF
jgi:chemotaxis protein MotB